MYHERYRYCEALMQDISSGFGHWSCIHQGSFTCQNMCLQSSHAIFYKLVVNSNYGSVL